MLGEVVLKGVHATENGAPVTRIGQFMPCAAAVMAFTRAAVQLFSPLH